MTGRKNVKINQNRNYNRAKPKFGSFVVDVILLFIVLLVFLLEITNVLNSTKETMWAADIIIVLLPTIITVLSIVLSLSKEKIYGVTLTEFNKLLGFWFYGFLHMVVCFITIFIIYTVFTVLNLTFSIYALDATAVVYSIYFSVQEIPILIYDQKAIGSIIKNRYRHRNPSHVLGKQKDEDVLSKIIRNIALTEGIKTAYKTLCVRGDDKYNAIVFDGLFDAQNHYFRKVVEDIEIVKEHVFGEYEEIDISKAIDMGFSNIDELLKFDSELDYKKIAPDKTHQLTRMLFSLHETCQRIGLSSKEKEKLKIISNTLCFNAYVSNESLVKSYSFLTMMTIATLGKGETWFLEALRDGDYSNFTLFNFDNNFIGLFISILIAHVYSMANQSLKDKLESFISEPSTKGLNPDERTWKEHVTLSFDHCRWDCVVKSLTELLNIYESIDKSYFEDTEIGDNRDWPKTIHFTKEQIFNAWLEIILFTNSFGVKKEDVIATISSLSTENKTILANYLPKKWITENKLNKEAKLEFCPLFFGNRYRVNENWYNKQIIDILSHFHDDYFKKEFLSQPRNGDANLDEIANLFKNAVNSLKSDEFFNDSLDLSQEKELIYNIRIDGRNCEELVNACVKELKYSIIYSVQKAIKENVEEKAIVKAKGLNPSTEDLDKVANFKPDFVSSDSGLFDNESCKLVLQNAKISKSLFLPGNFYGKNGSFSFRVEVYEENSFVRHPTSEEIGAIIDREYKMINGLYKFSENKNDQIKTFLVTRDELADYLKKSIVLVRVAYRRKVLLESGKYLVFEDAL